MMKIGIAFNLYGKGHARYGKDRFLKIAQCGFSAIDYQLADTDSAFYSMSDGELENKMRSERQESERAGIEISQVHGPWRYPPEDSTEENRAERMEKMKKSIVMTHFLGCKNWVVHPIMPYGTEELDTDHAQKTWDLNLKFMSELLEFAKKYDVTICLENMPMRNFSMAKPAQILKFVRTMNDEQFKICLDTGHVAVFPELNLGNVVRELGNELRVMHVHDNMGDTDSHLMPTRGCIDWNELADSLKEIGFDGVFSLETGPSSSLDDAAYETAGRELCDLVKHITRNV